MRGIKVPDLCREGYFISWYIHGSSIISCLLEDGKRGSETWR